MRKILGTLAAMAGLMAIAAPPTVVDNTAGSTTNSKHNRDQLPMRSSQREKIVIQSAGGFNVLGDNSGTPPHIYGQFYVRRGTHKRSNKK